MTTKKESDMLSQEIDQIENTKERNKQERKMDKFLVTKKESFFKKVLKKIKYMFFKNKYESNLIEKENNFLELDMEKKSASRGQFRNNLKADIDFEVQTLKVKLDNGEIEVIDLTDEQIDKLKKIYDREVAEKKLKLQRLRKKQMANV